MDKNAISEYKWPNTKCNKKPVLKCQVKMNGKLSNVFKSEIGVRQGDNLSPLLFSIYLSDLESFLSSKYGDLAYISELTENDDELYESIKMYIILYADDTVILAESLTELQMSLDAMQSYCDIMEIKYQYQQNKNSNILKRKSSKISQV